MVPIVSKRLRPFGLLSALLVGVSLASAAERTSPQDAAAAAIEKLHGVVERDSSRPGRPVIGVTFGEDVNHEHLYRKLTASDFDCLKSLTDLQRLELDESRLGDAILERIAGLTKLRVLKLCLADVTDSGLRHLQRLTALEELDLSFNLEITDNGTANLRTLSRLRRLNLGDTRAGDGSAPVIGQLALLEELSLGAPQPVEGMSESPQLTDAGMKDLRKLSRLKKLDLGFTHVTADGLQHLDGMPGLRFLNLRGMRITDAAMGRINNLRELEQLLLSETPVSDAGLTKLTGLSHLKRIYLAKTNITDAGLMQLHRLNQLEDVELNDEPRVGDEGLRELARCPNIERLDLSGVRITDDGVRPLGGLKKLRELTLWPRAGAGAVSGEALAGLEGLSHLEFLCLFEMKLGSVGLSRLPKLPSLREMILHGTRLKDDDLLYVARLPNLRTLELEETLVTDAGFAHLKSASKLEEVCLRGMQEDPDTAQVRVTEVAIHDLEKALPKLKVHY
jgi:Leucine-rich repeat (LRR) protein